MAYEYAGIKREVRLDSKNKQKRRDIWIICLKP